MSSIDEHFRIGYLLEILRRDVGDSEFGYRIQGLLAHVLLRIGGRITQIKPQGHPDIVAHLGSRRFLLQVKAVHSKLNRQNFNLSHEDLQGIRPQGSEDVGYLAILECVHPVSWILVDYSKLSRGVQETFCIVTLRAMADKKLSEECTEEFIKLIIAIQDRLKNLRFDVICKRALRGETL